MSADFTDHRSELAWRRTVRLAVELIDAVTLERVSRGVAVRAQGLKRAPVVNTSGFFVWLAEKDASATSVSVDPGRLRYQPVIDRPVPNAPAAPGEPTWMARFLAIELLPRLEDSVPPGWVALAGRLVTERVDGEAPVSHASVQLVWQLDHPFLRDWVSAGPASVTDEDGRFLAFARPAQGDGPRATNGRLRTRLQVQVGAARYESEDIEAVPGERPKDLGQIALGSLRRQ